MGRAPRSWPPGSPLSAVSGAPGFLLPWPPRRGLRRGPPGLAAASGGDSGGAEPSTRSAVGFPSEGLLSVQSSLSCCVIGLTCAFLPTPLSFLGSDDSPRTCPWNLAARPAGPPSRGPALLSREQAVRSHRAARQRLPSRLVPKQPLSRVCLCPSVGIASSFSYICSQVGGQHGCRSIPRSLAHRLWQSACVLRARRPPRPRVRRQSGSVGTSHEATSFASAPACGRLPSPGPGHRGGRTLGHRRGRTA